MTDHPYVPQAEASESVSLVPSRSDHADHPYVEDRCRFEYIHEGAHCCAAEGCEAKREDHPDE